MPARDQGFASQVVASLSPVILVLNSFAFLCGKSLQNYLARQLAFPYCLGSSWVAACTGKDFFFFLLSGEGNKHFKRAFKKSWSLQEDPGSFSFNRAAVFGNALRKPPGALTNLLVNSRRVSLLLAPGETAGTARVGLCCQLCAVFSNKNWPVGALVLKEWELETRGAVTAVQGQTQDAQGGRIRWGAFALWLFRFAYQSEAATWQALYNPGQGDHVSRLSSAWLFLGTASRNSEFQESLQAWPVTQAPVRRARKPTARNRSCALL